MAGDATSLTDMKPSERGRVTWLELSVLGGVIGVTLLTYWFVVATPDPPFNVHRWLFLVFVANLVPSAALIILIGRRVALSRVKRSGGAGSATLHVRLVALFTLLASLPIVLTAIVVSLMFQSGVQFWGSERARTTFETSMNMVRDSQEQIVTRWTDESRAMAFDLSDAMRRGINVGSATFHDYFGQQTYRRSLEQSILFTYTPATGITIYEQFNPQPEATIRRRLKPSIIQSVARGARPYVDLDKEVIWVLTPIEGSEQLYLYVATSANARFLGAQHAQAAAVLADYKALQRRANDLQVKFNLTLYGVALLIIAATTWVALAVADRLVRPVDELVAAARRVADGDLSAQVNQPRRDDEIGTLARAFNTMTSRLAAQTGALVAANDQLDSRRALIEAVVSGVSAGVIAIDGEGRVRLINQSALELLRADEASPVGEPLVDLAPELASLLEGEVHDAVIQVTARGEARTLAVKIAQADPGPIITFDDITQQLFDQRRAAWADVARRIAHEIKNPLTPIQLAAERLQRRYGRQLTEDDGTFARLTETIVRQVGDLRRMVDEFSSFARMPKPVFRPESVLDIARHVVLLHEVAHPAVTFTLVSDDPPPTLVCDRRQIAQALTNVVRNAVEAIDARSDGAGGSVNIALEAGPLLRIIVSDDGIGLPLERDRIVEPYMTTRARGTGLGLAIVKKIVEEHCGTIAFADRDGGGTVVSLTFDAEAVERLACITDDNPEDDARAPILTRLRK